MSINQIFKVMWHGELRDARYLGEKDGTTVFNLV